MRFFFGLKKTILLTGFLVLSFTWLSSLDFSASAQRNFGAAKKTPNDFSGAQNVEYKSDALAAPDANTAFLQQAKLLANDGAAQDNFGFSSAISGDTAIVGAPRNSGGTGLQSRGAAYIYVRSGSGAWTQQQKLFPSDGAATDQFGYSVAISGNTAAVGRYNTTTGQNRADGKVYIFTRTGSVWTETQTLVSNDIAQGDSFGYSLAFDGDTLAVGARNKNSGTTFFQGAAYIFTRPSGGGNFTQQAKLTASDGGMSDFFGESVSLSGDTAVIGSVNDFGQTNAHGKAYVFVRSGSTWTEQQILQATGSAANDGFGTSVSVSGDTAVIGANTEPIGATGELGAAYVFVRSGTAWTQTQKLTAQEATPRNDRFGYAVAVKGDTIAVGSPAHEFVSSIANHGAVYIFNRSGASWTRTSKLLHDDPAPDALGQSLAFDGSSIIAGAPSKNSARGAAYIFSIIHNSQPKLTGEPFSNPQYGQAVAISGNTAAVGSNLGVYIYVCNGEKWELKQKLDSSVNGTTTFSPGSSIAISGDTMVVGAGGSRINGVSGQGAVLVYTRNGSIWTLQQQLTASDGGMNDLFGTKVAFSDNTIIASAYGDAVNGNTQRGAAYVFVRNDSTWTEQQKLIAADGVAGDFFSSSVAISGNTAVIGAELANFGGSVDRGAAYVFTRSGTTWTQQSKLINSDGESNNRFGSSVAIENDTIAVGSVGGNNANNRFGTVYIFTRNGAIWTEQQKLSARDGKVFDFFGSSVALSGDKLLVGAYNADNKQRSTFNSGAVYIFNRQGATWNSGGKFVAFDAADGDQLGSSVAISNNLVISGAVGDDMPGVFNQGSAYIFDFNKDGTNFNVQPADFNGDGQSDLSVFRQSEANWYTRQSGNSAFSAVHWGISSDKPTPADFDGDGRIDYAGWRENGLGDPNRSYFFVLRSSDNTVQTEQFGSAGDNPNVAGDWDGDGKADVAVYRGGASGGQGYFYYRPSSQSNVDFVSIAWGAGGDKAVRGDFDGDGKLDAAVFRPSERVWYVRRSGDGVLQTINWGLGDDRLVPADYDGDGKTDFAVFRPSDRTWYIQHSANSQFVSVTFGLSSDLLAPADYDGDGKTDIAVYRDGSWIILQTSNGNVRYDNFGTNADVPVAGAHLQ